MAQLKLSILVSTLLLVMSLPVWQPATAQTPDDAATVTMIQTAYDRLLDYFTAPLDPSALLTAGWQAATSQAAARNLAMLPALRPLPADRDAAFAAFAQAFRASAANLPASLSPLNLAFLVVDGMARSLKDSSTAFRSPAADRISQDAARLAPLQSGFGFLVSDQAHWVVTQVGPGSPADRAGLEVGDQIAAIGGRDVRTAAETEFFQVFGEAADTTSFSIVRDGEQLQVTAARGPFFFPPLASRVLPDGVGLLQIRGFGLAPGAVFPDGTEPLADLDRRLDDLEAQGVHGLVLDLRDTGCCDLPGVMELLGRFLPEDAIAAIEVDQRGRQATVPVSGTMRPLQLPLVVLVNRTSTGGSEIVAAALQATGRALLVGQHTAGQATTAKVFSLPAGAALRVSIARVLAPRASVSIEGTGVAVDREVVRTGTPAGYRQGRDTQVNAAILALDDAPLPPPAQGGQAGLAPDQLSRLFARYLPAVDAIPVDERLPQVVRLIGRALTQPNQTMAAGVRDPAAGRATMRQRGWLGAYTQVYAAGATGATPSIEVTATLYGAVDGAAQAVASDDIPHLQAPVTPPVELGEQTVAYTGRWLALGSQSLLWRRGRVVFRVTVSDRPGLEQTNRLVAVAELVDQAYAADPLLETPVASGELNGARVR
ncbi:MAG: S41 family peptidase [Dehalococcoidia bacterium]